MFVGKMPPLRTYPRHRHHVVIIRPVATSGTTFATVFELQQWTGQRPLANRYPNPRAKHRLLKAALNRPISGKGHTREGNWRTRQDSNL